MKVLVVHAHENPKSFCSSLMQTTQAAFENFGFEVSVSDLYQMNFNPVASKNDFKHLSNSDYYKLATEQLHASKNNLFSDDLKIEMDKLIGADIINFNFPFWWFGMPAILKGWVDRVMAYGVAYGGEFGFHNNGRFKKRKAFITMTTGSPEAAYLPTGSNKKSVEEILYNIHEGIFGLVGYEVLNPFVAYGVSRITNDERLNIIENYKSYLKDNYLK